MMRKYIAATLSIAVAIGPASALDVGVSGNAGGVGVSAGASVGSNGVSAGVGAGVGGIGGVSGGASAGSGGVSGSASVGAGGASGGASVGAGGVQRRPSASAGGGGSGSSGGAGGGGTSAGSRSDASRSAAGSGSAGTGGIGTTVIRPAKGVRGSIILPPILRPSGARDKTSRGDVGYPPLSRAIPGTPTAVVRACQKAIASAAAPLGAVRVRAASAGPVSRQRRGAITAPIAVRIDYARQGGIQVRQAKVRCRLDAAGRVIAVM